MKIMSIAVALAVYAASANAQPNGKTEADIEQLLTAFIEAQRSFDVAKLDALLAPDYIEISPLGEVDRREKVLTFYAPDKKVSDTPIATLDEFIVRVYGNTAVTIARLTYEMKAPDGAATSRSMRCVFVTRSIKGSWKIASSQFTPMRN
jgi:ketosteroid isomerase-like protein